MKFQKSQDDEYLRLCIHRVHTQYLTWVEQVLDIIIEEKMAGGAGPSRLNDIGCNVGQFLKGLKRRSLPIDYMGYDIDDVYLETARKLFPNDASHFCKLDICRDIPRQCEISVTSATLEHLEMLSPALDNLLASTERLAVIRTFLGEHAVRAIRWKEKAETYYYVNQYSFLEVFEILQRHGFSSEVIRDRYTDSLPHYLGQGIVRSHYIVVGLRK